MRALDDVRRVWLDGLLMMVFRYHRLERDRRPQIQRDRLLLKPQRSAREEPHQLLGVAEVEASGHCAAQTIRVDELAPKRRNKPTEVGSHRAQVPEDTDAVRIEVAEVDGRDVC